MFEIRNNTWIYVAIMEDREQNFTSFPSAEQLESELEREKYKKRYGRVFRSTIYTLIIVAAVAVLVAMLWMPVLQIYGTSMSPTLNDGEIVVSVKTSDIKCGDVVAFYYGNKLLVKRCIAEPFDWVDIDRDGTIFVNGEALDEPYIKEKAFGDCDIELPYQVPEGKWFLVGDYRAISVDSRNTKVGCISQEQIVGKITFKVWPLSEFGSIK